MIIDSFCHKRPGQSQVLLATRLLFDNPQVLVLLASVVHYYVLYDVGRKFIYCSDFLVHNLFEKEMLDLYLKSTISQILVMLKFEGNDQFFNACSVSNLKYTELLCMLVEL